MSPDEQAIAAEVSDAVKRHHETTGVWLGADDVRCLLLARGIGPHSAVHLACKILEAVGAAEPMPPTLPTGGTP